MNIPSATDPQPPKEWRSVLQYSSRRYARRWLRRFGMILALTSSMAALTPSTAKAQSREERIDYLLKQDPNLRYVENGDKFYRIKRTQVSWPQAELKARTEEMILGVKGQLGTIGSAEENEVVKQLTAKTGGKVWIAGSDNAVEGTWRWMDKNVLADTFFVGKSGSPAIEGAYTNFAPGQPDDWGKNEDYLEIAADGRWNDAPGVWGRFFLVEWPAEALVGPNVPQALSTVKVPVPSNLSDFVKDRNKAILLGKALFWDMQVGSDGKTACATCHNDAGVDHRFVNTLNPGAPGSAFGPQLSGQQALRDLAVSRFRGANATLAAHDFPFHRVENPLGSRKDNPVTFDTMEVAGSQGVVKKDFVAIEPGNPVDKGQLVADSIFNIGGSNARQVTGRNTPTMINAVFFDRLFWDGRANHYFNGVNPFGELDPNARVLKKGTKTTTTTTYSWKWKKYLWWGWWSWEPTTTTTTVESLDPVAIRLNNAALASQAVGPPNNPVEMSWLNREFKQLGRKMLSLRPLAQQKVHPQDSVLGPYAQHGANGLQSTVSYDKLIREAFVDHWWNGTTATSDGFTHMESNFSMFWGIAIMMYESTLVSDQTPFDRFAMGDSNALSESAKRGLRTFVKDGDCINCHGGPEFAGATVREVRSGTTPKLVEFMTMGDGKQAFYDSGFYNIGVRQTLEDIAVGAKSPFGPLSYTQQKQAGRDIGQSISVGSGARIAVNGAFKTPSLRNIELTGPYFHNGGARTLEEVVQFYTRGADFFHENIADLDPDVDGVSELRNNPQGVADLVAFLKSLTDERVRFQKAPFDHPELIIPNGHNGVMAGIAVDNNVVIPAVGMQGGEPIKPFEETVK